MRDAASPHEEGDDDVTLNPLDPETEEKLREQHGIDLPGWTPNRPAACVYEADNIGRVYEVSASEVLPTGLTVAAWASRNDITQEEFDRHLRMLDERDRRSP